MRLNNRYARPESCDWRRPGCMSCTRNASPRGWVSTSSRCHLSLKGFDLTLPLPSNSPQIWGRQEPKLEHLERNPGRSTRASSGRKLPPVRAEANDTGAISLLNKVGGTRNHPEATLKELCQDPISLHRNRSVKIHFFTCERIKIIPERLLQ